MCKEVCGVEEDVLRVQRGVHINTSTTHIARNVIVLAVIGGGSCIKLRLEFHTDLNIYYTFTGSNNKLPFKT